MTSVAGVYQLLLLSGKQVVRLHAMRLNTLVNNSTSMGS